MTDLSYDQIVENAAEELSREYSSMENAEGYRDIAKRVLAIAGIKPPEWPTDEMIAPLRRIRDGLTLSRSAACQVILDIYSADPRREENCD